MMSARIGCLIVVVVSLAGAANAGIYDAAVLADNPFVYYRFEEASSADGQPAIDTAGGDQNGTYYGGLTVGQPSAAPNLGSSGLFAGSDDRIDLPSLGSYSQHSIEMWINTAGLAGGCCTSLYHTDTWTSDATSSSLHYNVKSGRSIEHAVNGTGSVNINTPNNVILDGNWYHVVSTYDATNNGDVEIYINGVNQNVGTHNSTKSINLGTGGEIGT